MSFGRWYEEKKNDENGDTQSQSSSSWMINTDQLLPVFSVEGLHLQPLTWSGMKEAMESQMPKTILGMGYAQRFKVFCGLIFLSVLFFGLAFFVGVPLLAARPQKFALSFTCGSLIFMMSFGILKGPVEHLMSMLQPDRLPFTFFYLLSMFLTLHFTFSFGGASGYLLVLGSSGMQLLALVWYLISFLPGGATGLTYVFAAISHLLKPVLVACARCQAACFARCVGWMAQRATSG